jgi:hypothetical protein
VVTSLYKDRAVCAQCHALNAMWTFLFFPARGMSWGLEACMHELVLAVRLLISSFTVVRPLSLSVSR